MTREEARIAAEVMMAYAEGKEIEFSKKDEDNWNLVAATPVFNWKSNKYRVKEKPTYRPFKDKEECWNEILKHQPFGWVKHKGDGVLSCLSSICDESDFCHFYEKLTFTNGTPFGIKDE